MPKLNVEFRQQAWGEYSEWSQRDPKIAKKVIALVNDARHSPFSGVGKPEPLRYKYLGYWSRRITDEHCLIYTVIDETLVIIRCYGHYDD